MPLIVDDEVRGVVEGDAERDRSDQAGRQREVGEPAPRRPKKTTTGPRFGAIATRPTPNDRTDRTSGSGC
jgi:hypothetical protein